jgi:hypothetical protein
MKALVLNALGRGFDVEDVDIAAPIGRVFGAGGVGLGTNRSKAARSTA